MDGAPGEIRTPDRSVRSRVLYPAELQALILIFQLFLIIYTCKFYLLSFTLERLLGLSQPSPLRGRPPDVQNRSRRFCQTPDRSVRSRVLYPAELQALNLGAILRIIPCVCQSILSFIDIFSPDVSADIAEYFVGDGLRAVGKMIYFGGFAK